MDFYFDSRNPLCKTPFGAIDSATECKITLFVSRRLAAQDVRLCVITDSNCEYHELFMDWESSDRGYDGYTATLPALSPDIYWYSFKVDGVHVGNCGGKPSVNNDGSWQLSVYEKGFETPDWIKGGIYYHIFVDRFNSVGKVAPKSYATMHKEWDEDVCWRPNSKGEILNDDFFGGNLKGITAKLPYLKSLGVTCLYLSPIFEAFSNHKYDTSDYMSIDSMFGSEKDFKELCSKAHKSGIKIVLDGVFNHVGSDSVYFNKNGTHDSVGAYQSQSSPYYKWFNFSKWPTNYSSWWGFDTLPDINESDPSYIDFITGKDGVLDKWTTLGADGWRLDVADELPDSFICHIRDRIKKTKSDGLLIGEVWEDASTKCAYGVRRKYFGGRELDSVMNYPFRTAIIDFIRNRNSENLADTVCSICENYPKAVVDCLMNLLGTHDSDRIITALAGDILIGAGREQKAATKLSAEQYENGIKLLKLASALQMTLPGVPCIYYGDEAGLEGYNDPFNRHTFPWDKENAELTQWYKTIARIRKAHAAFKDGTFTPVASDGGFFAFIRESGDSRVLVAINRSTDSRTLNFSTKAADLLNGETINGTYTINPDSIIIAEVKSSDVF